MDKQNMSIFEYSTRYDNEGNRLLVIDVLPETACCFDCVYCPCGRTKYKTLEQIDFGHRDNPLVKAELEEMVRIHAPQIVLIESKGEAFLNEGIDFIIDCLHEIGCRVRLLTTGYPLDIPKYRQICNLCDEIVAELRVTSDQDLQKYQRPLEGIHLGEYAAIMYDFRKQYKGRFILEATMLRRVNDTAEDIEKLALLVKMIRPDHISVMQFEHPEKIHKAFCVPDELMKAAEIRLRKEI